MFTSAFSLLSTSESMFLHLSPLHTTGSVIFSDRFRSTEIVKSSLEPIIFQPNKSYQINGQATCAQSGFR